MDNWGVFQTIICIVSFLAVVIPLFVRTANVIQKNTIVINTLTEKLEELTVSNNKDHEHFHKSINQLEKDQALLESKHDSDIKLLKQKYNRKEK